MKNTFQNLLLVLCAALLFSSCDQLEDPIVDFGNDYRDDLYGPPPVFENLPIEEQFKHVLVEDFTGHECGNCPAAHAVAASLKLQYGDSLSVLAIHATSLAEPNPPDFPANYTTPEGNEYWQPFSGLGIPIGRVNRSGGIDNPWPYTLWGSEATTQFTESPLAVLQIMADYVSADNVMNVHVQTDFIQDASSSYKLVILVTENHVISPQLEYTPDPVVHEEYEHEHMLRGSVNGAFGTMVAENPIQGTGIEQSYTYVWNSAWVPENCTIVAYLYDATSTEIINCVETDLVE